MDKRYIYWPELHGYCADICAQMVADRWIPDVIVGITRGGAVPAVMISHFFKCKMIALDVSLRDSENGPETNCWIAEDAAAGKKILIVDDINDTGSTINWIVDDWTTSALKDIAWGDTTRFAMICDNLGSKAAQSPTYCGFEVNKDIKDEWIVFPWEDWWKA